MARREAAAASMARCTPRARIAMTSSRPGEVRGGAETSAADRGSRPGPVGSGSCSAAASFWSPEAPGVEGGATRSSADLPRLLASRSGGATGGLLWRGNVPSRPGGDSGTTTGPVSNGTELARRAEAPGQHAGQSEHGRGGHRGVLDLAAVRELVVACVQTRAAGDSAGTGRWRPRERRIPHEARGVVTPMCVRQRHDVSVPDGREVHS